MTASRELAAPFDSAATPANASAGTESSAGAKLSAGTESSAGRQFQASLVKLRASLPLATEILGSIDRKADETQAADGAALSPHDHLAQLTETINRTNMGQPMVALAHQLNSRDLRLIFPLLAGKAGDRAGIPARKAGDRTDNPANRTGRLQDKLLLIIRERASPSLYRHGWMVFQQAYPCQPVARALAILCRILDIKQTADSAAPLNRLTSMARKKPLISGRPGQVARLSRLPMINELVSPDARSLPQQLLHVLEKTGRTLPEVMARYQVQPNWPLGLALIRQAFLNGATGFLAEGQMAFDQVLSHADEKTQASLLHQLLAQDQLERQIFNRYCQVVYRRFGNPEGGHAIWRFIKKRDRVVFQQWVIAATIGSHCRQASQSAKARLYLKYVDRMTRVVRDGDHTLLIYFADFMVADSNQQPLMALYYDNPQHLEKPYDGMTDQPANLDIPHRQVDDAIRRASRHGVVGLPFDEEGIKLTSRFLDFVLQDSRKPGGSIVRRFLGN